MTDDKFTELVNLYLDNEISAENFKLLEAEISERPERKRAFTERCRLHQAMRIALEPHSHHSPQSGRRSNSRTTGVVESNKAPGGVGLSRWVLASGMAAAVVIGFVLLPPLFKDVTDSGALPGLASVAEHELLEPDPLESLEKSDLRRFANFQEQSEFNSRSSLIAQMRLMGLRPEYTPADKELKDVEMAAAYKPTREVNQAELFKVIQGLKAMPEPKLLRVEQTDTSMRVWPHSAGFDSAVGEPQETSAAKRF